MRSAWPPAEHSKWLSGGMGCKQTPTRNTGDSNNVYCSGSCAGLPTACMAAGSSPRWRHTALAVSGRRMPSKHTVRRERCKPHRCTCHHYTQKPQAGHADSAATLVAPQYVGLHCQSKRKPQHHIMPCTNAATHSTTWHTHSHARHALLKQQICQARALRHCYVAAQNSLCIHALTSVHTSRELFKLLSGWMGSNAPRGPASDCYRRCKHTRTHNTQT